MAATFGIRYEADLAWIDVCDDNGVHSVALDPHDAITTGQTLFDFGRRAMPDERDRRRRIPFGVTDDGRPVDLEMSPPVPHRHVTGRGAGGKSVVPGLFADPSDPAT